MGAERRGVRRLLMSADSVGGVWNYSLDLAAALAPHGVELLLATMGGALSPAQRAAARALPTLTVEESDYRLEWMEAPWAELDAAGAWLLDLARHYRPDIVHLNGYAHAALPWQVPVVAVGHSCVLSWWEAVRGGAAPEQWARYRRAVRRGLHAADAVVAPTRAMLAALERHYGPLPGALVIPNGARAERFHPAPKEPLVLAVGRLWDEAKNIELLRHVAPMLPWPVYVAGESEHPEGNGRAPLEGLHGLGALPPDALAAWYGRAAIYTLPARYEPFGLSVLEAALSGCALVLGDIPSLRELWEGAALFVPPDDAAALTAALRGLIQAPARREALAARARQRAAAYSLPRQGAAYHALYERLAATATRSTGQLARRPGVFPSSL